MDFSQHVSAHLHLDLEAMSNPADRGWLIPNPKSASAAAPDTPACSSIWSIPDVIVHILSYCDALTAVRVSGLNTACRRVCRSELPWKTILRAEYGVEASSIQRNVHARELVRMMATGIVSASHLPRAVLNLAQQRVPRDWAALSLRLHSVGR